MENIANWVLSVDPSMLFFGVICLFAFLVLQRAFYQNQIRIKLNRMNESISQVQEELNQVTSLIQGEDTSSFCKNDTLEEPSETKVYIGNVDYDTSEDQLEAHFNRFGKIEFVNIPINRYNGKARGFGFVAFKSKSSAEKALELNGSEFRGRQIQVNFAKERIEA